MIEKEEIMAKMRESLRKEKSTTILEELVELANKGNWEEVFDAQDSLIKEVKRQIVNETFDVSTLHVIRELIPDSSPNALSTLFNNPAIANKLQKLVSDYFKTDKVYVGDYKLDKNKECPYQIIVGDVIPAEINQEICLPNTLLVYGTIDGYYNPEKSKVQYLLATNIESHQTTGDLRCVTHGLWAQRYHGPTLKERAIPWGSLSLKNMEYVSDIYYLSSKLQDTDNLKYCGSISGDSHYPFVEVKSLVDDKSSSLKRLGEFSLTTKDAENLKTAMQSQYQSNFTDKISCIDSVVKDTRKAILQQNDKLAFN